MINTISFCVILARAIFDVPQGIVHVMIVTFPVSIISILI